MSNRFANEEKVSKWGYYSGYEKPKSVEDQIDIIRSHWSNLDPDPALRYMREVYPNLKIPRWVEDPFALVRPKNLYCHDGSDSRTFEKETNQLAHVLAALRLSRGTGVRLGNSKFVPQQIHRTKSLHWTWLTRLTEQQSGDILIIPAQFGLRHRGRSIRRAREMFGRNEFGLDSYMVGTMLLTHPERLQHRSDLNIDCAGDAYDPLDLLGREMCAPNFNIQNMDCLYFSARWIDEASPYNGSASGYLPT